jgi:hypothetical protein
MTTSSIASNRSESMTSRADGEALEREQRRLEKSLDLLRGVSAPERSLTAVDRDSLRQLQSDPKNGLKATGILDENTMRFLEAREAKKDEQIALQREWNEAPHPIDHAVSAVVHGVHEVKEKVVKAGRDALQEWTGEGAQVFIEGKVTLMAEGFAVQAKASLSATIAPGGGYDLDLGYEPALGVGVASESKAPGLEQSGSAAAYLGGKVHATFHVSDLADARKLGSALLSTAGSASLLGVASLAIPNEHTKFVLDHVTSLSLGISSFGEASAGVAAKLGIAGFTGSVEGKRAMDISVTAEMKGGRIVGLSARAEQSVEFSLKGSAGYSAPEGANRVSKWLKEKLKFEMGGTAAAKVSYTAHVRVSEALTFQSLRRNPVDSLKSAFGTPETNLKLVLEKYSDGGVAAGGTSCTIVMKNPESHVVDVLASARKTGLSGALEALDRAQSDVNLATESFDEKTKKVKHGIHAQGASGEVEGTFRIHRAKPSHGPQASLMDSRYQHIAG